MMQEVNVAGLAEQIGVEHGSPPSAASPSRWRENHGSLLMLFFLFELAVGSAILLYRQNRFVPPRFPDADMIETLRPADIPPEVDASTIVAIRVTGAVSDDGVVKVAIYDSAKNFNRPDEAILTQNLSVAEGIATWNIAVDQLPKKFAVAAYHDENFDAELNRNRFGIPTERYGFSRNARGLTGPPEFKEAVIDRPSGGRRIQIGIR